jgi:hypothetical protein
MSQAQIDLTMSPAAEDALADQRNHQRHLSLEGGVVRLAVRPAYRGQLAILMDLSAGGLGLLVGEPLEPGSVLAFDLFLPQGPDARGRLAYVRHCTPYPAPKDAPWHRPRPLVPRLLRRLVGLDASRPEEPAWLIGCEFNRPLADDELATSLHLLGLNGDAGSR